MLSCWRQIALTRMFDIDHSKLLGVGVERHRYVYHWNLAMLQIHSHRRQH